MRNILITAIILFSFMNAGLLVVVKQKKEHGQSQFQQLHPQELLDNANEQELQNQPNNQPSLAEPVGPGPSQPPKTELLVTQVETQRQVIDNNKVFQDVMSHARDPYTKSEYRSTNVHETAHDIHNDLMNKYSAGGTDNHNGFYLLDGQAVVLKEPGIRKSQVSRFVPQILRVDRFNLYIAGSREWDDRPLYIYDEWVSYVLGGMTNIVDSDNGRELEWSDGVSGCLEFSIYAVALCMAVKEYDPEYFAQNEQFRLFTIYMLNRAKETYMAGHQREEFKWDKQDKLLFDLLNDQSEDTQKMREFMKEHLAGAWLN